MPSDAPALDHLMQVMVAAGAHDLATVTAQADAALAILAPYAVHKARADIVAVKDYAHAGRWSAAHNAAWQAISGLTHSFPPDPVVCPPVPDDERPYVLSPTCGACETSMPTGSRFCPLCGTPTA